MSREHYERAPDESPPRRTLSKARLEMASFQRTRRNTDEESVAEPTYISSGVHRSEPDDEYVQDEANMSTTVKEIARQSFWKKVGINGSLIAAWYAFSICISVYNKWMFGGDELNFHFPLFTTSFHMIVQFLLCGLALWTIPALRPPRQVPVISSSSSSSSSPSPTKPSMSAKTYLLKVFPAAAVTGTDIGLGNASLQFITLTFFTMCKSSTLGFVLLFSFIFKLEKPTWRLGAIILIMSVGVFMMVFGETDFNLTGFLLLMGASASSGLRWALTQKLIKGHPACPNAIATLFWLTPSEFVILFSMGLVQEGFPYFIQGVSDLAAQKGVLFSTGLMLFPGFLAFCMTCAEFHLISRVSIITLSVGGMGKEVLTVIIGRQTFGDILSPINITGLCVTLSAIGAYHYIRTKAMQKEALQEAQNEVSEERAPMLSTADPGQGQVRNNATEDTESTAAMMRRSLSVSTYNVPRHNHQREHGIATPLVKQNIE